MWLPKQIVQCVAFLCVEEEKTEGEKQRIPKGTGFFVSIDVEETEVKHSYFVTAKHCVEGVGMQTAWLRANRKDGAMTEIEMQNPKWFFHPDESVDVAVTPFEFEAEFDPLTISTEMFLTAKDLESEAVGIGNEVMITGLFSKYSGRKKISPVVRVGNIAMLPDEKIPTRKYGDMDAYLIEARSIGGLSGSPTFFLSPLSKGGLTILGNPKLYLGGLIHGHWDTPVGETIDPLLHDIQGGLQGGINMGLAIVTPAIKIQQILDNPRLKEMRTEKEDRLKT